MPLPKSAPTVESVAQPYLRLRLCALGAEASIPLDAASRLKHASAKAMLSWSISGNYDDSEFTTGNAYESDAVS
jgi:hypothetical protein